MAEFSDISLLLKIANSPIITQFLHDCVDELTRIRKANFDKYNNEIEWTTDDFNRAKIAIQSFYRQCILTNSFELRTENLPSNLKEEITNCFDIRKQDIYEALVKETLVKNGHQLVDNFDWRLKWILGSSKLASIREPVLQVDLNCLQNISDYEEERKLINFEMNAEQLENFIQQLERVQMEHLSKQKSTT